MGQSAKNQTAMGSFLRAELHNIVGGLLHWAQL